MAELIEKSNKILMGDFDCKEVNWKEWTTEEGEESWGNVLMRLAMENLMTLSGGITET